MFCAYKPCIDGFKHCKPVIYVDGTFLCGKYRSILLTAEAVNGILPLAFALVEKESKDNRNFDSNLIASYIQAMLQEQPGIKVKAFIAGLKERFGITPSYKKVWKGKQKAIANL